MATIADLYAPTRPPVVPTPQPLGFDDVRNAPPDYSALFNTQLTPDQEAAFQQWAGGRMGDLFDYDLRGAWQSNAQEAANGHLPDTWKKPNHPTFSSGSQYSTPDTTGGEWAENGPAWEFRATPFNMQMTGGDRLQRYFDRVEQGNRLVLPPITPTPVPVSPLAAMFGGSNGDNR